MTIDKLLKFLIFLCNNQYGCGDGSGGKGSSVYKFCQENEISVNKDMSAILIPKFIGYNDQEFNFILKNSFGDGKYFIDEKYIMIPIKKLLEE